jgi:hypothetical protein
MLRGEEKRWKSLEKERDERKVKERNTWPHQKIEKQIFRRLSSTKNFVSVPPMKEAMGAQ